MQHLPEHVSRIGIGVHGIVSKLKREEGGGVKIQKIEMKREKSYFFKKWGTDILELLDFFRDISGLPQVYSLEKYEFLIMVHNKLDKIKSWIVVKVLVCGYC